MDAREYLNRQGVPLERDTDRPNTLEEKSWERAREAGQQRPKVGTPHDWEDWERYHDDLAHDADALTQKIDKDAHRKATVNESTKAEATPAVDKSVEFFSPKKPVDNVSATQTSPLATIPTSLKAAYFALAVLFPPLAVALTEGGARRVAITTLLTLCVWLPGVVFALVWLRRQ